MPTFNENNIERIKRAVVKPTKEPIEQPAELINDQLEGAEPGDEVFPSGDATPSPADDTLYPGGDTLYPGGDTLSPVDDAPVKSESGQPIKEQLNNTPGTIQRFANKARRVGSSAITIAANNLWIIIALGVLYVIFLIYSISLVYGPREGACSLNAGAGTLAVSDHGGYQLQNVPNIKKGNVYPVDKEAILRTAQSPKVSARVDWINKYHTEAQAAGKKYGVPASVLLAQSIMETGTRNTNGNNLGGLKGNGGFRQFNSTSEYWEAVAKNFTTTGVYEPCLHADTWFEFAYCILPSYTPLNTDEDNKPTYLNNITAWIKQYDLEQYDAGIKNKEGKQYGTVNIDGLKDTAVASASVCGNNSTETVDSAEVSSYLKTRPVTGSLHNSYVEQGFDGPLSVQCTYGAWCIRKEWGIDTPARLGNGGQWCANAGKHGLRCDNTPEPGAAVSFVQGEAGITSVYGHVAVVKEVKDGKITILETNSGSGKNCKIRDLKACNRKAWVCERTLPAKGLHYVH